MAEAGKEGLGLLLAMMQPVPMLEDEFNDWYDMEHQPGRAAIAGFLNARRFICIDGFPRYLAIYDMDSLAVLQSEPYLAAAFQKFSHWGKRVLKGVLGQFRGEAVQLYPGKALFGAQGVCSRLIMWRFRQPSDSAIPLILKGLKALYEGQPAIAQFRLFRSDYDNEPVYIALVEARVPMLPPSATDLAVFGEALKFVDLVNTYAPYIRPSKQHGIQR